MSYIIVCAPPAFTELFLHSLQNEIEQGTFFHIWHHHKRPQPKHIKSDKYGGGSSQNHRRANMRLPTVSYFLSWPVRWDNGVHKSLTKSLTLANLIAAREITVLYGINRLKVLSQVKRKIQTNIVSESFLYIVRVLI